MLRSVAMAIAVLVMVRWMRPVLRNARSHAREVVADTRAFGLSMYSARLRTQVDLERQSIGLLGRILR